VPKDQRLHIRRLSQPSLGVGEWQRERERVEGVGAKEVTGASVASWGQGWIRGSSWTALGVKAVGSKVCQLLIMQFIVAGKEKTTKVR